MTRKISENRLRHLARFVGSIGVEEVDEEDQVEEDMVELVVRFKMYRKTALDVYAQLGRIKGD